MTYSTSLATVHSRLPLLRPLLNARNKDEVVWQVPPGDAQRTAYHLRECLAIARRNPRELPQLARLAELFQIFVVDNLVIARRIPEIDLTALNDLDEHLAGSPLLSPSTKIFPHAFSVEQIIQTWLDSGPAVEFTQADLATADYDTLQRWAENMDPQLEILAAGKGIHIHIKGVSR